ncbi:hypothetical protein LJC08_01630 [Methanimicrococcus sp. OttesenSCG-928-J09]|nr:hypothetical protein [Methanimicrococcus sp. OttesenSCG-928-J09]
MQNQTNEEVNDYLDLANEYSLKINCEELPIDEINNFRSFNMPLKFFISNSILLEDKQNNYEGYVHYDLLKPYIHYYINLVHKKENLDQLNRALDFCVQYCLYFKDKDLTINVFEYLLKELKKAELASSYLLIANSFHRFFHFDFVHYYIDEGLKTAVDEELHLFYNVRATAYANDTNYYEAIKWYQRAIESNNNFVSWNNLAVTYYSSVQYTKALISIQEAISIMDPDSEDCDRVEYLKSEFKRLSSNNIDIGSIKEEDIRETIIEAEKLILSTDESVNYATVALDYAIAIESILNYKIAIPIYESLINKYSQDELNDFKKSNRSILCENILSQKSPVLGTWISIKKDLKKSGKDNVSLHIKKELENHRIFDKLETLNGLKELLPFRHSRAHKTKKIQYNTIAQMRQNCIPYINIIIDTYY